MNNEEQSNENHNLIENLEQAGLSRRGFLHGMGGMGAISRHGRIGWQRRRSRAAEGCRWERHPRLREGTGRSECGERLAAGLRSQDPGGHRRIRPLQVRSGVLLSKPPQCRSGGRHRSRPRALCRTGQGSGCEEDLPVLRRDDQGQEHRGGLHRDRRTEPRPPRHHGAESRQACRLRGSGGVRV